MTYETAVAGSSRKKVWAGRVISALPVLALLFSGSLKLASPPGVVQGFGRFGYPEVLIRVLGIVEVGCTIVYLIPRTSVLGAILVTGYFGGAVATHARVLDPMFLVPLTLGVLAWVGLLLREPRLHLLIPLRGGGSC
jgi:hypothetical protein